MGREPSAKPTRPRRADAVPGWDLEADVVVVGLGCAGAATAIEAAQAGADVLVLERASGGGGTSALSGGLVYLGGGTPVQKSCGFDDSPDEMFKYLMTALGPEPDEAKIRLFCDGSVEHFHWLVAHGVPFKESFHPEPSMESPTDDCLVYSGGEDCYPFDRIAKPAPRGHKPRADGAAGGFLMQRLIEALERTSARRVYDANAETLVVEDAGRVVGLVARWDGAERLVRARRGVVLTAGGFVTNPEMVRQHSPRLARCSWKLSAGHDDGSAIRMAQGLGAATIRMDAAECAIPLTPPRRLVRGILVNRHGQRFVNEDAYYGVIGQAALFREGGEIYFVHDDDTYEVNLAGMEVSHVGETLAELEAAIGLPEGSLQATVALYNRHAERGEDPVFHKSRQFLKPLTAPPFGAIDCGVDAVTYATFTLGGLHTWPTGEVLTPDAEAIPGLYAAGRTTSGLAASGYCSGISLADGTFFGRLAGRSAAKRRGGGRSGPGGSGTGARP